MSGLRFVDARLPAGRRELCVAEGAIAASADDGAVIDCGGRLLLPAVVDLGVFAIDRAAFRAGGIARVALMPDQAPPLDHPGLVQRASLVGKPDLWIHPLAAATQRLEGRELAEMASCAQAGARAVATGRGWVADSGVMRRVLSYARDLDLTVIVHAEDDGLTGDAVATDGEIATRLGLPSAPAAAEALAIARDLILAEETGARLHFRQVTTAAGFDLVRQAKARGVGVSCGVTPAHWLLSETATADYRTFTRLSPPLRSEDDRKATLAAIGDGTVDVLCSGHDPRGPEAKRLPFADAEPGMAGAETLLAHALALVRDEVVTLPRLCALLAGNPLRLLGLSGGDLSEGTPADLILVDADVPWIIDTEKLLARAGNTPFDGMPVQGRVLRLWKGGREVR